MFPVHLCCGVNLKKKKRKVQEVPQSLGAVLPRHYRHSGSVVERPLCDREVAGSIPGRVIPKTLKMVLAALSLGAQH